MPPLEFTAPYTLLIMMLGSKGQKAVHACMIRLLNLGPAKHEEGVICVANQRIPNVCRIAGAACCGAIRGHQLGAKDLLTPTSYTVGIKMGNDPGEALVDPFAGALAQLKTQRY